MYTSSSLFVDAFALFIFIMEFEELLFWNDPIIEGSAFSKLLTIDICSLPVSGDVWGVFFIWIQSLVFIPQMWLSCYIKCGPNYPGIHYWDYYPVALSLSGLTATHLKIGHP